MNETSSHFYAKGKLLLSGEYVVLDGALSLALPTKQGQCLDIYTNHTHKFTWESHDEKGNCWLKAVFNPLDFTIIGNSSAEIVTLQHILQVTATLNPNFGEMTQGKTAISKLNFPRNWGLGSSSTLISLIAQWANINPYHLLAQTFGGSGYDIACATANMPILYQLNQTTIDTNKPLPQAIPTNYIPPFVQQLYFVYLERKQNSRQGISQYRAVNPTLRQHTVQQISQLTQQLLNCSTLPDFENLLRLHEQLIAYCVQLPTVQSLYFDDYWGVVKSLGAWGGDFVLATAPNKYSTAQVLDYFKRKGFYTIIAYSDMIIE